jgi:S1-C subfamily serine protease
MFVLALGFRLAHAGADSGITAAIEAFRTQSELHAMAVAAADDAAAARCVATRDVLLAALPRGAGPLIHALALATDAELATLPRDFPPATGVARLAVAGVAVNPWIGQLGELPSRALTWTLRAVQPAVVRVIVGHFGGTGVNLSAEGRVLTAAHVVGESGSAAYVEFPDGTGFRARVTTVDGVRDLALLTLDGGVYLPVATLAATPPTIGERVVVIGHPGRGPTPPFQVSWGNIVAFRTRRDGDQSLGATSHDASTDWGHSGSPLFDSEGRIVALHNSWDPRTDLRHAVSWEAITHFLGTIPEGWEERAAIRPSDGGASSPTPPGSSR